MKMYNLEIAQDHTFTVGEGEWIVHNCGVGPVGGNEGPSNGTTMQDILNDPWILKNMTPAQVEQIGVQEGWVIGTLGRGTHEGQGLTLRQLNASGTGYTDKFVEWHPGGGQHGPSLPDTFWECRGRSPLPGFGVSPKNSFFLCCRRRRRVKKDGKGTSTLLKKKVSGREPLRRPHCERGSNQR
jgi:hypothetical protein